jgi:putative DNA primase/helicase
MRAYFCMTIDEITSKLKGVKRSHDGFVAKCPAHDDRTGSLSVGAGRGKVLMHCFAGTAASVVKALGLVL